MFSWICPQCGRDVPPTKTDCPFCAEKAAALAAAGPPVAATQTPDSPQAAPWQQPPQGFPPQQPTWPPAQQAPPQYSQPPAAQYAPPQQYQPQQFAPPQQAYAAPAPPPQQPQYAAPQPHPHTPQAHAPAWTPAPTRSSPPTWLVALGFAAVLILVGGGIWFFVLRSPDETSAKTASASTPTAAANNQAGANPYQKYVEVVGVRMVTEDKKPVAKFVVVNHSAAEIDNLEANVRLWASTSRSEEDQVGSFSFKIPELAANSSKDMTVALKTKKKMYELPDWQNTTADVQITSPTQ